MEELLGSIFTIHVLIAALIVGGIQEMLKQAVVAYGLTERANRAFKTLMAVLPLPLGALAGWIIIPMDGVAEPWVLGVVAGLASSKVYDMLSPAIKAYLENGKKSDADA